MYCEYHGIEKKGGEKACFVLQEVVFFQSLLQVVVSFSSLQDAALQKDCRRLALMCSINSCGLLRIIRLLTSRGSVEILRRRAGVGSRSTLMRFAGWDEAERVTLREVLRCSIKLHATFWIVQGTHFVPSSVIAHGFIRPFS